MSRLLVAVAYSSARGRQREFLIPTAGPVARNGRFGSQRGMAQGQTNLGKGLIAGVVAGLAGTWLMTRFQNVWSEVEQQSKEPAKAPASEDSEPATVKTAEAISGRVLHHELKPNEKPIAGNAVHFGFGVLMGTIYGVVAEALPKARAFGGAGFGTAVWAGADNVAVPALGLGKWPTEVPLSRNVYGFVAHLVYGCSTEIVRRVVRRAL